MNLVLSKGHWSSDRSIICCVKAEFRHDYVRKYLRHVDMLSFNMEPANLVKCYNCKKGRCGDGGCCCYYWFVLLLLFFQILVMLRSQWVTGPSETGIALRSNHYLNRSEENVICNLQWTQHFDICLCDVSANVFSVCFGSHYLVVVFSGVEWFSYQWTSSWLVHCVLIFRFYFLFCIIFECSSVFQLDPFFILIVSDTKLAFTALSFALLLFRQELIDKNFEDSDKCLCVSLFTGIITHFSWYLFAPMF